jgi:hypothetical protein
MHTEHDIAHSQQSVQNIAGSGRAVSAQGAPARTSGEIVARGFVVILSGLTRNQSRKAPMLFTEIKQKGSQRSKLP